jgi:hypothetical protein
MITRANHHQWACVCVVMFVTLYLQYDFKVTLKLVFLALYLQYLQYDFEADLKLVFLFDTPVDYRTFIIIEIAAQLTVQ